MAVKPDSNIYVAGHRGLAGSALVRRLQAKGYRNILTRTHAELELIDAHAVQRFFAVEKPDVVFLKEEYLLTGPLEPTNRSISTEAKGVEQAMEARL